jgi:AbrB family transcriptional regulator, stage V sporulation protein T
MKATGIVRRIDDLGRVVIPKEIRRTMRIREGEPLEIFVDREGEVILKKYSPMGELSEFAQEYADALAEESNNGVFILDRDVIIAVSGVPRKVFLDKKISSEAERVMEERRAKIINEKGTEAFCQGQIEETGNYSFSSAVLSPIIVEGDPIGVVVISNKNEGQNVGDLELKLANTAALFLAKQMEQ